MLGAILLTTTAGMALCVPTGTAGDKARKEPPCLTGALTVEFPSSTATTFDGPKFVLVSLYRDGELIRSRELEPFRASLDLATLSTWRVQWKNLPCGTYDVCFEARGYARGVKRVRVSSEDGDDLVVHVELDKAEYRIGDELRPATSGK